MIAPLLRIEVLRREDQLRLLFDLHNLHLDKAVAGAPVLRRTQTSKPAFVVVRFPAQHLAEEVFREPPPPGSLGSGASTASDPLKWPADGSLSGPSRLAFAVPVGVDVLPFTVDALLRWGQLALSVSPRALARGAAPPAPPPEALPPLETQTAIELPWHLLLSPHAGAGFAHALGPVTRSGRTELWHTRLGVALPGGAVDERGGDRSLRAIWGTDFDFVAWIKAPGTAPAGGQIGAPGLPFRMTLSPKNRVELVRATSDYGIPGFAPAPVQAERLMLSSLGGWLDVRGTWNPPPNVLSIQEWKHRTVLGRDQDVRVVERGYLLPFGHPATVVAVTERKLGATPTGAQGAYLRERLVLVVTRPVKEYAAFGQAGAGRRFPFRRLTVATTATPVLDGRAAFGADGAFVPRVGGAPYEFHFVAEDLLGRRSEFTAPVVFVDSTIAFSEASVAPVRVAYNGLGLTDPLRRRTFDGKLLALAESQTPGATDAETSAITFGADAPAGGQPDGAFVAQDQPRFHPGLARVAIRLAAAEQLAGAALGPIDVALDDTYVVHGFDPQANSGQVYAALVNPVGLVLDNDRAGPMTPGMTIVALSRTLGPVGGDLTTLKQGTYDAPAILAAAPTTPRILGGVKLSDIIPAVNLSGDKAPDGAMVLTTERSPGATHGAALAPRPGQGLAGPPDDEGVVSRFKFRPQPVGDPLGILEFFDYTFCQIDLEIRVSFSGKGPTEFLFQGLLSNAPPYGLTAGLPDPTQTGPWVGKKPAFVLRLLGDFAAIEVEFIRFAMRFETGKENYINPVVGEVRFNGCLQWIDDLRELLNSPTPPGSAGVKPIFSLSPSSLEVGLKIVFPDFPCGVFTIKNVMVGFSVLVPFKPLGADNLSSSTGSRAVRMQFRFSERENPFVLAVYCFGGGGFLTIGLGTDGVEWFEVALEFGIHASADFGVASGILAMMAGIYFQITRDPNAVSTDVAVELTGYFRARGHLAVLGIVTITLEVYLGLTYESVGNKVTGQATVTLEVTVLFFSMSVGFTVQRQLSGDSQQASSLRGLAASPAAGGPGTGFFDQIPSQELWDEYAGAFAPVGG